MEIALDSTADKYLVRSYQPGKITINNITYTENLILTPQTIISPWLAKSLDHLSNEHIELILKLNPSVVIFGSGSEMVLPIPSLMHLFQAKNIGIEIMNTHAACRTYNVLVSEDRAVVAAMIL